LVFLTIISSGIYPLLVTGIAQVAFPSHASGSLILNQAQQPIGSSLIASRSMSRVTSGAALRNRAFPYNAAASSGSNLNRPTLRCPRWFRRAWRPCVADPTNQ
jgi:potassium-transporting ATPase KdpC subunit